MKILELLLFFYIEHPRIIFVDDCCNKSYLYFNHMTFSLLIIINRFLFIVMYIY